MAPDDRLFTIANLFDVPVQTVRATVTIEALKKARESVGG